MTSLGHSRRKSTCLNLSILVFRLLLFCTRIATRCRQNLPFKGFSRNFLTFCPTHPALAEWNFALCTCQCTQRWNLGENTSTWVFRITFDFLGACCPSPAPPPFLPLVTITPSPPFSSPVTPGILPSLSLSLPLLHLLPLEDRHHTIEVACLSEGRGPEKSCCSFGFCPTEGGKGPAQIFCRLFIIAFLVNNRSLN